MSLRNHPATPKPKVGIILSWGVPSSSGPQPLRDQVSDLPSPETQNPGVSFEHHRGIRRWVFHEIPKISLPRVPDVDLRGSFSPSPSPSRQRSKPWETSLLYSQSFPTVRRAQGAFSNDQTAIATLQAPEQKRPAGLSNAVRARPCTSREIGPPSRLPCRR